MLSIIVAMTDTGVIGRGGELPWRLRADLARFKRLTMGHAMIMGRKTYESIGRPLPGRVSIVVTRQADYNVGVPGVLVATSLGEAITLAGNAEGMERDEIFVIGGGELYRETLFVAKRLYVTRVLADVEGDTTFPDVDWAQWTRTEQQEFPADAHNEFATRYEVWERVS